MAASVRARRVCLLGLVVFGAQAASAAVATTPTPANSLVARGAYLARAADCMSCHTTPGKAPYAGGAALHSPFGDLYGPNITPDPQTGIGRWSEAEFTRAVRQGIRKGGAPLYPAMPYDSYSRISDDDIHALWAYMRSVAPMRHASTPNTLRFPMNLRRGVTLWQSVYFKPGRFEPRADKDEVWNRGAYLVTALGHCGDCHTPRNFAQASESGRPLEGGRIENWYAPDISSDALSKVASLRVDDLQRYLKTGKAPGNVQAFGPMRQVVHDSLGYLADADLRAMAVYLKDQPAGAAGAAAVGVAAASATASASSSAPSSAPSSASSSATPATDEFAAGARLYELQCANCHQKNGRGVEGQVPALAGNSAVTTREAYNVVSVLLQGLGPQGRWAAMPSFASQLDDAQVAALSNYVRNSWGNRSPRLATPSMVAALRADAPPSSGPRAALLCPVLPAAVMQPAWKAGSAALRQSAADPSQLQQLVASYEAARPRASAGVVVEALSAAYCRAITADGASAARTQAAVIDYSQQVAALAVRHAPAAAGDSGPKRNPAAP